MGRRKAKAKKPDETEDTSSEHSSQESEESGGSTTPPGSPDKQAKKRKKVKCSYRDCNPKLQGEYYVTAASIEGKTVRRKFQSIESCRERFRLNQERRRLRTLLHAENRARQSSPPVDLQSEVENEKP